MIDSHCHLQSVRFVRDLPAVLADSWQAGLTHLMVVGCDLSDSREALALAKQDTRMCCAVGIHPHEARHFQDDQAVEFAAMAAEEEVWALGEMGLDYHYDHSPRALQQQVFSRQLEWARQLDMPVVLHTRQAEEDTLALLRSQPPPRAGQAHCFTGSRAFAEDLLDEGFYLGFTGIVTFPDAAELREVVGYTPLDRLLIETDCPYLAPVPHRGKRNQPSYLPAIVAAIARVKGIAPERVIEASTENFYRLFRAGRTRPCDL